MNLVEKNYNSSAYCMSIVHNVPIYLLTYIYIKRIMIMTIMS